MPQEKPETKDQSTFAKYLVLSPLGQEGEDLNYVMIGPLTKKQLVEMGIVKNSSVT